MNERWRELVYLLIVIVVAVLVWWLGMAWLLRGWGIGGDD